MPPRPPASPRGVPGDVAVLFVPGLPEGEVGDVFLFVLVGGDADARAHAVAVEVRELAVGGPLGDAEVDGVVRGAVGVALLEEPPDEVEHLGDVRGGLGVVFGGLDVERADVVEKRLLVLGGELAEGQPGGARVADGLVVHVREVHHLRDAEALVPEPAPQQVLEDVGAEVPDVRVVVDRRPARVHADVAGLQRNQLLLPAGERVVRAECGGHGAASSPLGGWNARRSPSGSTSRISFSDTPPRRISSARTFSM